MARGFELAAAIAWVEATLRGHVDITSRVAPASIGHTPLPLECKFPAVVYTLTPLVDAGKLGREISHARFTLTVLAVSVKATPTDLTELVAAIEERFSNRGRKAEDRNEYGEILGSERTGPVSFTARLEDGRKAWHQGYRFTLSVQ